MPASLIIGGPSITKLQELIDMINVVMVPLGLTGSSTITQLLSALQTEQNQQGV